MELQKIGATVAFQAKLSTSDKIKLIDAKVEEAKVAIKTLSKYHFGDCTEIVGRDKDNVVRLSEKIYHGQSQCFYYDEHGRQLMLDRTESGNEKIYYVNGNPISAPRTYA